MNEENQAYLQYAHKARDRRALSWWDGHLSFHTGGKGKTLCELAFGLTKEKVIPDYSRRE
jgi:hypothetical protein